MLLSIYIMLDSTFFHLLWLFSIQGISLHNKDCVCAHVCLSLENKTTVHFHFLLQCQWTYEHFMDTIFLTTQCLVLYSRQQTPPHGSPVPRSRSLLNLILRWFPATKCSQALALFLCWELNLFPVLSAHQPVSHSCGLDDRSGQHTGMNMSWRRNGAQVEGLG